MNVILRPVEPDDIDAIYAISLATGDSGGDASHLYRDHRMVGHIYAAPYVALCPELCLVAEDDHGVAGFVVGTLDTRRFEAALEERWWPALRAQYPDPSKNGEDDPESWSADTYRHHMIHHPRIVPDHIVRTHPGHLHINLLARGRRRGVGSRLLSHWLANAAARGCTAVHAGVNGANRGAMAFWRASGFDILDRTPNPSRQDTVWYGSAPGNGVAALTGFQR